MPTPACRRLTFSGVLGSVASPIEEWSFRLNLDPAEGTDQDGTAVLQAAADAYDAQVAPLVHTTAILTEIKYAQIGAGDAVHPGGVYLADPQILQHQKAGAVATSAAVPQVALAVSLETERRGPTGRGRVYLPLPNVGTYDPATGLCTVAYATSVATNMAALITAINGPAGFGNVCIASTKGYSSVVTRVRCGRVFDTIRSRRRSIQEAYTADVAV